MLVPMIRMADAQGVGAIKRFGKDDARQAMRQGEGRETQAGLCRLL